MKLVIPFILLFISALSSAQPFRFVVAADGTGDFITVQAAINACPDNERSLIFVKNGTYYGQTYLGTKTAPSTKLISLIGEDRDKVILSYDKSLPMVTKFEEATTFQIYAKDFYAESITFANTAGVSAGQALALYTAGDKATLKNCYITGFQDTYRSKKGTRAYLKDCIVEGTVDFIYAGGTVFFDDCTINCLKGGGYITAPEDAFVNIPKTSTVCGKTIQLGFFFRNCNITANSDVMDNSYYLGRPWTASAGSIYLNCKLGKHIKPAGWQTWNGNEATACFAEYNSMDANGAPLDITSRVSWSFQLPKADVDNLLTPEGVYARVSTTVYDPLTLCIPPNAPANVRVVDKQITWDAVPGVAGYLIYKNNRFLAAANQPGFTDTAADNGTYSVMSVAASGVLSVATGALTALTPVNESQVKVIVSKGKIHFSEPVKYRVYNVRGMEVKTSDEFEDNVSTLNLPKGVYLLELKDKDLKSGKLKVSLL
jgi:pectin methylesterase-like acyl-CoA thioesterase